MYSSVYFAPTSNKLHIWEYNSFGKKEYRTEEANLYFYIEDNVESEYKSIYGNPVRKVCFKDYNRFKEMREMYATAGRKLYESDIHPMNRYILDAWSNAKFEKPHFDIFFLDIEVHSEQGFPHPEQAEHPITIITIYSTKQQKYYIFAEKEFDIENVVDENGNKVLTKNDYVYFAENEEDLISKFVNFIHKQHPDILSGWNSNNFDIPYIINRGYKLIGEKATNKISPIGRVRKMTKKLRFGKEQEVFEIAGISLIDYLDLYKKYNPKEQSSFKLDYIARVEKVGNKLEYEGSLRSLYHKNWQTYCEYNIQDVALLHHLDTKIGFMDLMIGICYNCCVPFEQFQKTTKVLDGAFISRLCAEKIVVPDAKEVEGMDQYEGAFVRPPTVGCHDWVISFDATSLYPSIMMQHNISPETKVFKCHAKATHLIMKYLNGDDVQSWELNLDANDEGWQEKTCEDVIKWIKSDNLSIASNGAIYRHDKVGVVSRFVKEWFDKRQYHKKQQFKCHQEGDKTGEKINKGLQTNYKILINSVYGYVGSIYSRFYDKDNAVAVTATGQDVIQTAMNSVDDFFKNKWTETEVGKKLKAISIDSTVIYGDTDSGYFNGGNVLRSFNWQHIDDVQRTAKFLDEKITPIFVKVIDAAEKKLALKAMNCPDCKILFKREMIARRGMFLAKKRYVAWVIIGEDGPVEPGSSHEIEVKGLESVRSSTPEIIRKELPKFYKKLIQSIDRKEVDSFVRDAYNRLIKLPPEDIAKYSSANNIQKYTLVNGEPDKGTPWHIKGCIGYNKLLKMAKVENDYENIMEGDKIKSIYIKGSKRFTTYNHDVISFKSKIPKEFEMDVDMEKMVDKVYIQPLQQFYDIMNWQMPSIKTENIEDFFE